MLQDKGNPGGLLQLMAVIFSPRHSQPAEAVLKEGGKLRLSVQKAGNANTSQVLSASPAGIKAYFWTTVFYYIFSIPRLHTTSDIQHLRETE